MRRLPFALALLLSVPAAAQEAEPPPDAAPARAVLIAPIERGGDVGSVAHALDRIVRQRLEALNVVTLGPTPAIGLSDLQLAVGCVAESPECLSQVAGQLSTDELLYLEVARVEGALVVSLDRYVVGGELQVTTRRHEGEDADNLALDAADAMVRQAYGLPPPDPDAVSEGGPTRPPGPAVAEESGGYDPVVPIVLMGIGVAVAVTGIVVGAVGQSTYDEFLASPTTTDAEIDAANTLFDQANEQAIAANVLIPLGGAFVVGGAIVWIVGAATSGGGGDEDVALLPMVGPTTFGASVQGRFEGGL